MYNRVKFCPIEFVFFIANTVKKDMELSIFIIFIHFVYCTMNYPKKPGFNLYLPIAALCLYNIQRENRGFKKSLCILFTASNLLEIIIDKECFQLKYIFNITRISLSTLHFMKGCAFSNFIFFISLCLMIFVGSISSADSYH